MSFWRHFPQHVMRWDFKFCKQRGKTFQFNSKIQFGPGSLLFHFTVCLPPLARNPAISKSQQGNFHNCVERGDNTAEYMWLLYNMTWSKSLTSYLKHRVEWKQAAALRHSRELCQDDILKRRNYTTKNRGRGEPSIKAASAHWIQRFSAKFNVWFSISNQATPSNHAVMARVLQMWHEVRDRFINISHLRLR